MTFKEMIILSETTYKGYIASLNANKEVFKLITNRYCRTKEYFNKYILSIKHNFNYLETYKPDKYDLKILKSFKKYYKNK